MKLLPVAIGLGSDAELLDDIAQLKAALCDSISFAKLGALADSELGDFCTGVPCLLSCTCSHPWGS